jgi:hypothetical protein
MAGMGPGWGVGLSYGAETGVKFYPGDLDKGPFMRFTTFSMKGGVGSGMSDINFGGPYEHVCLPIPTGLNSQYGQSWDQKDVSVGESTGGNIGELSKDGKLEEIGSDFLKGAVQTILSMPTPGGGGRPEGVYKGAKQIGGAIQSFISGASGKGIKDVIDATKVGAVGAVLGAQAQRALGQAGFSNSYMTYGGPGFRQFSFTFNLKALSQEDTAAVDDIVKFFKFNSAPRVLQGGLYRIYELPRVFKISFHTKEGEENKFLPKISKCALTNVGVTYGGAKYSEFENHAPVETNLSLSFKEVSLLSQGDIFNGY